MEIFMGYIMRDVTSNIFILYINITFVVVLAWIFQSYYIYTKVRCGEGGCKQTIDLIFF